MTCPSIQNNIDYEKTLGLCEQMKSIKSNPKIPTLRLHVIRSHTFPEPEQFEHLSVLGVDKGRSPPLFVETGSIRTSDPVLEQRAQARYPAFTINVDKNTVTGK